MSRTFRRTERHLFLSHYGTVDDIDQWDRQRYGGRDDVQCFKRKKARFQSDKPSGKYSAPHWWRLLYYNKPSRTRARRELHRCLRNHEWDDHLTIEPRGARSWYWWIIH